MDVAAWVQAIGSIIAIPASVGIAVWQAGKQNKQTLQAVEAAELRRRINMRTHLHRSPKIRLACKTTFGPSCQTAKP